MLGQEADEDDTVTMSPLPPPPTAATVAGPRLLVVEDTFIIAFDLQQTIIRLGYGVLGPVASAAEALDLLRGERPDAALLDAELTDGWATPVARALRDAGVPYALLTAHDPAALGEPLLAGV